MAIIIGMQLLRLTERMDALPSNFTHDERPMISTLLSLNIVVLFVLVRYL